MKGSKLPPEVDSTDVDTPVVEVPDISVYEAKIAELNSTLAERDATIATKDAEISAAKVANYDLLMSVPGDAEAAADVKDDESKRPTLDDLFD